MALNLVVPWTKAHGPTDRTRSFKTPPEIIYRYLPMSRVDSLISEKYLYFSAPINFNDPFDMYMGLLSFYMHKADARSHVEVVYPGLSGKAKKLKIEEVYADPNAGEKQKKVFEELRSISGICCFSESPNISLMWSHYANSHSGVCFGFNIEPFPYGNTYKPLVQAVNYREKIESVNGYDNTGKAVGHWLLTKSHIWSYEQEVRAIFMYRNGKVGFDQRCLKEVYFGCNVEDNRVLEIIDLLKANGYIDIKCYKMVIDESIFDIKANEVDY